MLRTSRRVYRCAGVAGAASGFRVELDGRPLRTPAGREMLLPTAALAAGIANEWLRQDTTLRPATMPLTRIAATAVDRVAERRAALVEALMAYARSDLLCYRAEAPDDLVLRQTELWQPLLDWVAERWDARLIVAAGVLPVEQPEAAIGALTGAVAGLGDFELAALASAVEASGSLLIGLALLHRRVDAAAAAAAALLDECYQAERWGADPQAEQRRAAIADDLRATGIFLTLAGLPRQAAVPVTGAGCAAPERPSSGSAEVRA